MIFGAHYIVVQSYLDIHYCIRIDLRIQHRSLDSQLGTPLRSYTNHQRPHCYSVTYGSFGPLAWCLGKSELDVCCSFIVSNLVVLVVLLFLLVSLVSMCMCVSLLDSCFLSWVCHLFVQLSLWPDMCSAEIWWTLSIEVTVSLLATRWKLRSLNLMEGEDYRAEWDATNEEGSRWDPNQWQLLKCSCQKVWKTNPGETRRDIYRMCYVLFGEWIGSFRRAPRLVVEKWFS